MHYINNYIEAPQLMSKYIKLLIHCVYNKLLSLLQQKTVNLLLLQYFCASSTSKFHQVKHIPQQHLKRDT